MLIFTRRWGPVAIKYPTVPIGIFARCSRASRKSAPRTLWIALVRAPRQFVPRQDEKLLRLAVVPLPFTLCTVRVQCIGGDGLFLFFNFYHAVLFSSIPFIRSQGMMRRDRTPILGRKIGRISGEEGGFFSSTFLSLFFKFGQFLSRGCAYSRIYSSGFGEEGIEDVLVVSSFPRIYGREGGVSRKGREDELGKGWRSFFRRVSCTKTELQVVFVSFSFFSCRRF